MVVYKLKVINVEDDTLNFSTIIQNINAYPREENKCGDDYRTFLTDDGNLCDTLIP